MKERFRKRLSLIMALVIVVTLLSQMRVSVYAETASLTNLGYLGTVNIGQKTESGMWYKLYIEDTPVFCMDLGKACHSGDTYKKISTSTVSSDSTDLSTVIKAKAGYWYYVTENESNKAWIIAQCLLWASEEGAASKTELIDIIGQIKDNAGYKTKTSQQLYDSIFANKEKVTCTVTKWESSSEYRQVLLQIKSGDKVPVKPKYHKVNREAWFRQRLTINKCAENGAPLETVKFKLTALNYKEMYSYYVEGHNTVSGAGDKDGFEMIGETDKNGMLGFRFTYRIQSKDFYYYNDEDLKNLSESDKVKLKKELDEKGYEYADSLTKTDAHILMDRDLNNQKDKINNSYLLEEISSGDSNISIAPEIISPAENSHGKVTRLSPTSFKIVLKNSWWRNDDKTWSDDKEGMNFQGAFLIVAVNKLKKFR